MNTPLDAADALVGRRKAPPPVVKAAVKREGAYKTIAEMAAHIGVATHVLRFWETKFPVLQPMKASGGRRFYRPEDVAVVMHIRELLYTQKLTIKGAQAALGKLRPKQIAERRGAHGPQFTEIASELRKIDSMLTDGPVRLGRS
jgi:DNA-binding transcriptional MerR regulator